MREAGLAPDTLYVDPAFFPLSGNVISRLSVSRLNKLGTTGFRDRKSLLVCPCLPSPAAQSCLAALGLDVPIWILHGIAEAGPIPSAQVCRAPRASEAAGRWGKSIPSELWSARAAAKEKYCP